MHGEMKATIFWLKNFKGKYLLGDLDCRGEDIINMDLVKM